MTEPVFVAADLGASSGRVVAGRVQADRIELTEVHRFDNKPLRINGTLHWDIVGLYRGVLDGVRAAGHGFGDVTSVGIDTWAVDYGLLDADGELIGLPVHYRDSRTEGMTARVFAEVPEQELYGVTGIQVLPINTVFQLCAARGTAALDAARTLLMLPDLLSYWLTGEVGAEVTNASTTQLYDATAREWALGVASRLALPATLFPPLRRPGSRIGSLRAEVLTDVALSGDVAVVAVGSHDTASAVVAVPARQPGFAYISCGTWSLVGVELDRPVLTQAARLANFTNEVGVDDTTRFLRNVMGLWLLQECLRTWADEGRPVALGTLLAEASLVPAFSTLIDPDAPEFLAPGGMPSRIAAFCRRTGQVPPNDQPSMVRCILDSLALAYRRAVREAEVLSGKDVAVVHLVGGGARNALLCQLTADACELPVEAGPVEAAALGNVLVQARAYGSITGGLAELRAFAEPVHRYQPGDSSLVKAAAERFAALRS